MLVLVVLLVISGTTYLPAGVEARVVATNNIQEVQTILPYNQLMTPKWIHDHVIITGPHALYPQYIEFPPTTGSLHQRFLQLQLVPHNILTSTDSVTATITVAMDNILASSEDHDPSFGISDGTYFVGFQTDDRSTQVCRHTEGSSGVTRAGINTVDGPVVTSQRYSSEMKIHIRPTEKWGSCHTEHDEGYTNIANYHYLLDLTDGLYLEMYRNHANEKYRIKYLMVDIELD